MKILRIFLVVLFFTSFLVEIKAQSNYERIINHNLNLTINPDSSLKIIEEITVNSNSLEIRRGIYREFFTKRLNNNFRDQNYKIISAKINNQATKFFVDDVGDYIRIRIGDPDVTLTPGIYKFTLEYEAFNSMGFFENHDEVYFNVTGNFSSLNIESVNGTIKYPSNIDPKLVEVKGFVGPEGSTQPLNTISRVNNEIRFSYNQTLYPGSGLTIVTGFPKSIFPPDEPKYVDRGTVINFLISLTAALFFILFIKITSTKSDIDEKIKNAPVSFDFPEKISPSEARFIYKQGFDYECLGVEILNQVVKKNIKLYDSSIDGKSNYQLEMQKDVKELAALNKNIFEKIFSLNKKIDLNNEESNKVIYEASLELKNKLNKDGYLDSRLVVRKFWAYVPYIILLPLFNMATEINDEKLTVFIILAVTTILISRLVFLGIKKFSESGVFAKISSFFFISFGFITILIIGINTLGNYNNEYVYLFLLSLIPYTVISLRDQNYKLTNLGVENMILIEGFRKFAKSQENYLSSINKDLPQQFNMYEKYLPYAIALDVDTEWSKKFKDAIDFAMLNKEVLDASEYEYLKEPRLFVKSIRDVNYNYYNKKVVKAQSGWGVGRSSSGFSRGGGFSGGGGGGRGTGGW